ncbi:hypothetical protein [Calothrix sp. UHCC 0171]|uniref:hypothetical protein n=1 Tax=Calothrix sp. UHCC 0171 TaxID=3110245 RepID=UPI002B20BEBE|nr:hypothetical protein [Calothrix sp. UHCC 0171]MEA5574064.1 hypothetical protein [Calothrix sp. UHCC 0171]
MQNNKPVRLETPQTAYLISQFPEVEYLEAGHIAEWLSTRKDQLLILAKEERIGSSLAKTISIATAAIGAVCYATSPLAPLGAVLGVAGYVWAQITDSSNTHTFNPIPFIRGGALDVIGSLGHSEARKEFIAGYDEFDQLKDYLAPVERHEYQMLRGHMALVTEYLSQIDSGKRFYAYRWICDQFILMRGSFPSIQQVTSHTNTMQFTSPLVDCDRIKSIQQSSHKPESRPLIQDAPPARIQDAPLPVIQDSPISKTQPSEVMKTEVVSFGTSTPNLIESITKKLTNTLIIGVPSVGKGVFVSNALESLKGRNVTVFYLDPKDDQKENGYFEGRVHKLYRSRVEIAEPEETYQWVKDCLAEYDAFDAGTGIKLLVFDELAAVNSMLSNVKGAVNWLKSKMVSYASSGSSRGIVIWGISQNAHVSGIGFDGGTRSIFTPIILISGDNITASEQILNAQIIPSDKRLNSSQITALCNKSEVNRAVFHGALNSWFPLPELENYSGFNRDKREFIGGVNPVVSNLERMLSASDQQTRLQEKYPTDTDCKLIDCISDKLESSESTCSYGAIKEYIKRKLGSYERKEAIMQALNYLEEQGIVKGNEEDGWILINN